MPDGAAACALPAAPLPTRGSLLGFDFGLARIGVASGELETRRAAALVTLELESNAERFAAIARLIAEWQPVALVVGLPLQLDGSEHELGARCRRFANQLHGRFGLPVALTDERLSSAEAEGRLREAGVASWRTRKKQLDAVAAELILQHFLDAIHHAKP